MQLVAWRQQAIIMTGDNVDSDLRRQIVDHNDLKYANPFKIWHRVRQQWHRNFVKSYGKTSYTILRRFSGASALRYNAVRYLDCGVTRSEFTTIGSL